MKSVSVTLSPPDGGFHGVDGAIGEVESVSRQKLLYVDVFDDDTCLLVYLLSGRQSGELRRLLDDHPAVIRSRLLAQRNFYSLYAHVEPDRPLTDLLYAVQDHALLYKQPLLFTDDRLRVTIGGDEPALQRWLEDLPEGVTVTVDRYGDYEPGVNSVLSLLTDRQREALNVALESGYYDTPRRTTCEELGAALDCSPSTANDLVREAERTVMTALRV
jgi:predicted DNA binding protein